MINVQFSIFDAANEKRAKEKAIAYVKKRFLPMSGGELQVEIVRAEHHFFPLYHYLMELNLS
jgi:hypothetical protein